MKETNLFFALAALLALFPDSPVAVLSRSPIGVVSSFAAVPVHPVGLPLPLPADGPHDHRAVAAATRA